MDKILTTITNSALTIFAIAFICTVCTYLWDKSQSKNQNKTPNEDISKRTAIGTLITMTSLVLSMGLMFTTMIVRDAHEQQIATIKYQKEADKLSNNITKYKTQYTDALNQMQSHTHNDIEYKTAQVAYYKNHDQWVIAQQKLNHFKSKANSQNITIHIPK